MFQLVPGHLFYPVADGDWRCVSPQLNFVRVSGPEEALRAVHARLDGTAADAPVLSSDGETLLGILLERGAVHQVEGTPRADSDQGPGVKMQSGSVQGKVGIVGSGPVADALARILGDGCTAIQSFDEGAANIVSALVVCAPQMRDTEWVDIDALCGRTGTVWHRAFVEGGSLIVGPFSGGGPTVSYTDYRARRRAAAATVEELDTLWKHLDSAEKAWNLKPDHGLAAVAAGLIAHDILCHTRGHEVPGGRCETEIDLHTGNITRHPVLPLPSGIAP